ncbi:hypothetical protein HAX54_036075, partial [Datura stramonium]|nr:hypothetical protein [Datura stramonium]
MSLLVYDSYTSAGHNAAVSDVASFSIMIPIFLKLSDFNEKRKDIDFSCFSSDFDIGSTMKLRVSMLNDSLPHQ